MSAREDRALRGLLMTTATHVLIVGEFDPDDDTDRFDVEHPAACPSEPLAYVPGGWTYDCPVAWQIEACGLDAFFIHAEDPARGSGYQERVRPGRHEIEAWQERVCSSGPWGPEEWDAGLRLAEPETGAA